MWRVLLDNVGSPRVGDKEWSSNFPEGKRMCPLQGNTIPTTYQPDSELCKRVGANCVELKLMAVVTRLQPKAFLQIINILSFCTFNLVAPVIRNPFASYSFLIFNALEYQNLPI